jgi:radical SAM superfamily enzyme YgiQ (UPF0313 family)
MSMSDTVLLVRPEPSRGLGAYYRNLGLSMIAAHVRDHGLRPQLVDLTFEPISAVAAQGAKTAVFSLYIDDFARGIEVAEQLKKTDPGLITFVGGPHATLLGADVLTVTDAFDYVGVGDCLPEAMPVIAAATLSRGTPDERLITGGGFAARMDELAPDYGIWPGGRYFPVFPVEFSRGCRQRCPFCTDPVLRRGLAVDPVARTLATITALVREHGRIWVRFVDSSMSSLGADLEQLLEALIVADLPVSWSAYAYPHDITAELAEKMARAGCVALFLGIESLGDGVRVGKHHTKRPEEVARAVDALHAHGIFVHGNFIIGLPGESAASVEQTLDGVAQVRFDSIGGGPFFLTPGSTFERNPGKFGIEILDPGWSARQHVNFYDSTHQYFRTATLTQPQMRGLAAHFRARVQGDGLACWNLSDYAALCWLSVGGRLPDLARLWSREGEELTAAQQTVVDVLKEKTALKDPVGAAGFVELAGQVATSCTVVPV